MRGAGCLRVLYALAAAGLGALDLAYADASAGAFGWRRVVALLAIAAAVAVFPARTRRGGMLAIGVYQGIWMLQGIPAILASPWTLGAWYGCCEALSALSGTVILYLATGPRPASSAQDTGRRLAQVAFGMTCIFYGASHFAYAAYTASMVPAWLPGATAFACLTGLGHVSGGIGIACRILPRVAAAGEALMMSLFGLLVWVPTFWANPPPAWATPRQSQLSELAVTLVLATSAWIVAASIGEPAGVDRRG